MGTRNLGFVASLAFVCMLLVAVPARAADTGFNQTAAGPWDYNASGNWVGGTINGIWHTSLTLTAAQTVTFGADTLLGTGWTFNYGGNQTLTLRSDGTADRLVTLGGDISASPAGASNQTVTIGSTTADQRLNIELGATRTFTVASGDTLRFYNVISGSGFGIVKAGAGNLTLSGASTYSGGFTLDAGTLRLGADTTGGGGSTPPTSGPLGTGVFTINGGSIRATNADGTAGAARAISNQVQMNGSFAIPAIGGGDDSLNGNWTFNGNVTLGANVAITSGGWLNHYFAAPITDGANTYSLTLTTPTSDPKGVPIYHLQANNTFDGGLTVGGTAYSTAVIAYTANSLGTGTVTLASNASLRANVAGTVFPNALKLDGNANIGGWTGSTDAGKAFTFQGDVTLTGNRTLAVYGYSDYVFAGAVVNDGSGSYTLTQVLHQTDVGGRLNLSGSNKTHTANIALAGGVGATYSPLLTISGASNTFNGRFLVLSGSATVSGSGNAFNSDVVAVGTTITASAATTFNGPVTAHAGRVLLTSPTFGGGAVATIGSSVGRAGVLGFATNTALPTVASSSSGVLAINNAAFNQSLSGLAGTDVYIGSTATGTYTGTALPTTSGAYRLGGGGGTLTISGTSNVLTGSNGLVIGRNGGGSDFAGTVVLNNRNDLLGTIAVNRGSTLQGLAQASGAGSPFGSTSGAITLNGGGIRVTNATATAREAVQKSDLTFQGQAAIDVSGVASGRVLFNPNTTLRSGTSAVIFSGISQTPSATTDRVIVSNRAGSSGLTANSIGYIAPYYLASDAAYGAVSVLCAMRYDDTHGFARADNLYKSGFGAAGSDDIVSLPAGTTTISSSYTVWGLAGAYGARLAGTGTPTVNVNGGFIHGYDFILQSTIVLNLNAETILACNQSTTLSLACDVTGNFGLTKVGSGPAALTTLAKNFVGDITILGGTLSPTQLNTGVTVDQALGNVANRIVLNGGTFIWAWETGDSATRGNLNHPIVVGANGGTYQGGNTNTVAGAITGTGLLTVSANASYPTTFSSASNTYSGGTRLTAGRLNVAAASSLGTGDVEVTGVGSTLYLYGAANIASGAALTVHGGCTAYFEATAANNSIAGIWGGGTISLGPSSGSATATLEVGATGASSTFYGVIANRDTANNRLGALVKTGTGTLTLAGANTYTGGTTINGGTLVVNGSTHASSAVTVNSGGTLGGTGTIGGTITVNSGGLVAGAAGFTVNGIVTVNSGGTLGGTGVFNGATTVALGGILAPGSSPGTQTYTAGLTINGTYLWELGALSTSNPGVDYDIAYVTGGNLTVGGSSALTIVFGTTPDPTSGNSFWGTNRTWTIIDSSAGVGGSGNFGSITGGGVYSSGKFLTERSGNDILLQWLSAPVAEAGGPYTCSYGSTVGLSGSVSGGTSPFTYDWDLKAPFADPYDILNTQNPSVAYGDLLNLGLLPGQNNTIQLRVKDSENLFGYDTATLYLDPLQIPVVDAKTGLGLNEYVCPFMGSIVFAGSVSGGMAPFTFEWDLDNDGQYDDALGATTLPWSYSQLIALRVPPSTWVPIGLRVTDTYGAQGVDTAWLYLSSPVAEPAGLSLIGLALLGLKRRRRS